MWMEIFCSQVMSVNENVCTWVTFASTLPFCCRFPCCGLLLAPQTPGRFLCQFKGHKHKAGTPTAIVSPPRRLNASDIIHRLKVQTHLHPFILIQHWSLSFIIICKDFCSFFSRCRPFQQSAGYIRVLLVKWYRSFAECWSRLSPEQNETTLGKCLCLYLPVTHTAAKQRDGWQMCWWLRISRL